MYNVCRNIGYYVLADAVAASDSVWTFPLVADGTGLVSRKKDGACLAHSAYVEARPHQTNDPTRLLPGSHPDCKPGKALAEYQHTAWRHDGAAATLQAVHDGQPAGLWFGFQNEYNPWKHSEQSGTSDRRRRHWQPNGKRLGALHVPYDDVAPGHSARTGCRPSRIDAHGDARRVQIHENNIHADRLSRGERHCRQHDGWCLSDVSGPQPVRKWRLVERDTPIRDANDGERRQSFHHDYVEQRCRRLPGCRRDFRYRHLRIPHSEGTVVAAVATLTITPESRPADNSTAHTAEVTLKTDTGVSVPGRKVSRSACSPTTAPPLPRLQATHGSSGLPLSRPGCPVQGPGRRSHPDHGGHGRFLPGVGDPG